MAAEPPADDPSTLEVERQLAAERGGSPFLVFRDAHGRQRIVDLGEVGTFSIGRGPATDISLDWDKSTSRLHAQLERIGEAWTVSDDGLSRNGTFVNDERVSGRRRLQDGDRLKVGDTEMVYRAPLEAGAGETLVREPTND